MAKTTGMTVIFKNHVVPDEGASKAQGRPIFRDMEVCEIRLAGNSRDVKVFPASEPEPNATRERGDVVTYAEHYAEQYRAFKSNQIQPDGGTPLSEAPFLTEARRKELQAMNVRTVETLAAIDGTPLKNLGSGGRELKNQAQAYLDNAAGAADVTAMAATIASLQQQLADRDDLIKGYTVKAVRTKYQKAVERSVAQANEDHGVDQPEATEEVRSLDDYSDQELKDFIKEQTGEAVRGNPSRETLITRANAALGDDEE